MCSLLYSSIFKVTRQYGENLYITLIFGWRNLITNKKSSKLQILTVGVLKRCIEEKAGETEHFIQLFFFCPKLQCKILLLSNSVQKNCYTRLNVSFQRACIGVC